MICAKQTNTDGKLVTWDLTGFGYVTWSIGKTFS